MSEDRLERIEAILERTVQLNQQTSEQQQQLTARFESLVFETQRVLNQLADRQTRTEASIETLADSVTRLTRNTETELVRWQESQAEIRRIWEYLLGQSRNGHSE